MASRYLSMAKVVKGLSKRAKSPIRRAVGSAKARAAARGGSGGGGGR